MTWSGSSIIPDGIRASFNANLVGKSMFYYRCPSGNCSTVRKLHINTVMDTNNNGFSDGEQGDEVSIGGAYVELLNMSNTVLASGYTSNNPSRDSNIGDWQNM